MSKASDIAAPATVQQEDKSGDKASKTYFQAMVARFLRHRLAVAGLLVLMCIGTVVLLAPGSRRTIRTRLITLHSARPQLRSPAGHRQHRPRRARAAAVRRQGIAVRRSRRHVHRRAHRCPARFVGGVSRRHRRHVHYAHCRHVHVRTGHYAHFGAGSRHRSEYLVGHVRAGRVGLASLCPAHPGRGARHP